MNVASHVESVNNTNRSSLLSQYGISEIVIKEYRHGHHYAKLYDVGCYGMFAVESDGKLFLLAAFLNQTKMEPVVNATNDGRAITRSLAAGIYGDPFLGMVTAGMSRIYVDVAELSTILTFNGTEIGRVIYAQNEKIDSADMPKVGEGVKEFQQAMLDIFSSATLLMYFLWNQLYNNGGFKEDGKLSELKNYDSLYEYSKYLCICMGGNPYMSTVDFSNSKTVPVALTQLIKYEESRNINIRSNNNGINGSESRAVTSKRTINVSKDNIDATLTRIELFLEEHNWESVYDYCEAALDVVPKEAMLYVYKLLADLKLSKIEELAALDEEFTSNINCNYAIRFADDNLKEKLLDYNEKIRIKNNEKVYSEAVKLYDSRVRQNVIEGRELFKKIAGYKDAENKVTEAEEILYEIECEEKYSSGISLKKLADRYSLKEAIEIFESLGEYKDSNILLSECEENYKFKTYDDANTLFNTEDPQKVKQSIGLFSLIHGYKDSDLKIEEAGKRASDLEQLALYESACRMKKEQTIASLENARSAFIKLGEYRDSSNLAEECVERIKELKYAEALKLKEKNTIESLDEAKKRFDEISAEKESAECATIATKMQAELREKAEQERIAEEERLKEEEKARAKKKKKIKAFVITISVIVIILVAAAIIIIPMLSEKANTDAMQNASIGDTFAFGEYAGESIQWQVIDKDGSKLLVISEECIENMPYNKKETNVTWAKCSLRKWLNSDFIADSFNDGQERCIVETLNINDDNPKYGTNGGPNTNDKVFLLSIQEANKYFENKRHRAAQPTNHAATDDVWICAADECEGNCFWWLRSPGYKIYSGKAAEVDYYGKVDTAGDNVTATKNCVRPVMWIDLSML